MEELWMAINGFDGLYEVSSLGRIKSLRRNKITPQQKQNGGYLLVHLHNKGYRKACTVHRLVAMAFIPNPNNKGQVNHIDGNKQNNKVANLQWVTGKENMRHAFNNGMMDKAIALSTERMKEVGVAFKLENSDRLRRLNKLARIPVAQIDKDGNILKIWESKKAAERSGYHNVNKVIQGRLKTCGGFKWSLL